MHCNLTLSNVLINAYEDVSQSDADTKTTAAKLTADQLHYQVMYAHKKDKYISHVIA